MIRPYLIARREDLPFSSQLAVWAIERIFDVGAFTILLIAAAFLATAPKRLAYYGSFREAGLFLSGMVAALAVGAIVVHRSGEALPAGWSASWVIWLRGWDKDCHPYSRIPRRLNTFTARCHSCKLSLCQ